MKQYPLGFSLTELLIGLFLSSVLILLLVNQFLSIKHHVRFINQAIEQDMELQLIKDLFRHSIHHAGFTPCLNLEQLVTADRTQNDQKLSALYIDANEPRLQIQRMHESYQVIESILSEQTILTLADFKAKQQVLIADCYHAEVHQIRRVESYGATKRMTFEKPLLFNFKEPIYIGGWINEAYFIHRNHHTSSLLYKQNHSEELSSLVHSMTVSLADHPLGKVVRITLELSDEQKKQFSVRLR
ncbi:hypothetical protein [Legionella impletisoli]|uniref:Tfp pilus assembly protein PilW n=1 Tax=Legionella impletisoli TaxID=343510 RepID=A0A917JQM9_9GAMM|nr:hypothetical protein [Legionella impletisoli]GGI80345.1 hypothetical protein GCM10007966_06090 [Legionella impletisoli]